MSRPRDPRRKPYQLRYKLTTKQLRHLSGKMLDQLDRCASDDERRLILGIKDSQ